MNKRVARIEAHAGVFCFFAKRLFFFCKLEVGRNATVMIDHVPFSIQAPSI